MGRAFEYRRAAKEKRWDKMSKMFPILQICLSIPNRPKKQAQELRFNWSCAAVHHKHLLNEIQ